MINEIKNPYIAGAPVTETRMFFGREDVFDWIEKSLSGQYADHILVVHGQRRVGKTSVLKQLGNRLPEKYLPVFFDLQGRTHTTLDRFLWWLARETVRVIKQERGIDVPPPEKELFARDAEYFENVFLPSLYPFLGDTRLLYTFDEFDNLDESGVKEELARPLTDYLRRLMGRGEMNFIFSIGSSGRKLENMQAAYTDFFKTALYKKISFLSEEQTHHLVRRPVEGLIEYEPAAVQRIYAISSGHPYFTQLTCHELFARCQFLNQRKITLSDVNAILDDVVERGTVNLKFVWDEASDIERWILASLACLEKSNNRTLAEFLHKQRVRCSDSDLTSALLHLREKDVLTSENNFVIHLLRLWLQKNRTIEQVREELTEVNPIANRYIEIGMEFKDSGLFDKAIGSFREALAIAPENIQAQVNIALTYMNQKSYDKAIAEFEQALKMDDEDISARSGLCEAHLALGDTAMQRNRTREALQSYQRVLSINVEHTEARQRMAELHSQRAEKALVDGKDEEALSAFSEALKYTPEDPTLIERVKNVREKKKAKVLAEQVARSEKEAASKNWDKAIAALNEALETAPLDESILKKMDVIKGMQSQEQLGAILTRVNLAEKASRWDTAIAGLSEYLQLKPGDLVIQQRIDSLIQAKHAAWLNAVTTRVDQAIAAKNWPEALTALIEALRLEPHNAEMQAKAAEVDVLRRKAELEGMLKNADRAAVAGRWDEVIELLNDGLVSYPGNETINTKLAQARQAKREARHKAALRLADTAAQAGKWKTAAESLEEILSHEPDNAEFQEKLSEIKSLERQSRLNVVQVQAQNLEKEERFEEALAAWNAYLSDEHADRQAALVGMERIKKAQNLASLYAEAGQASAKKNYEKAVDLYKSIVMVDADYKNATDLLAETVKLRRTAQKTSKTSAGNAWFTRGLLLLLAVGVGGVIIWLARNGLPAVPAQIPTIAPAGSIPATATQKTISTQTPAATPDPRVSNPANGHLYLYVRAEKSWPAARDYCTEKGGYLVTIQDTAENIFIYQLTNGETWLGGSDEADEGIWEWTSGETWNYAHWAEGQPDNDDHGEDGKEPYLTFQEFPGSWNDSPDSTAKFVCEWVPSPQGKTIMVTSVEDAGAGTLRQALLNAQAGDVIQFDTAMFPPGNPAAIQLRSGLPPLQRGFLTLDASNGGVILDGSQAGGEWTAGLTIISEYNVVKGLQILHFTGPGIMLETSARFNTVGGDRTAGSGPLGEGNLVGDNADGIGLLGSDNIIAGNLIGTGITGKEQLGNRAPGIFLEQDASRNMIGPNNVIAYNGTVAGAGIELRSVQASANTITANSIFNNQSGGISYDNILDAYKNSLYGYLSPPIILYFDLAAGTVNGVACKGCVVEIFSTDSQDGIIFEGRTVTDPYGNFFFSKGKSLFGPFLTATSRSPGKNTSEYSQPTRVRSAIQIALEAIQNEAPHYQTTFDSWDFGAVRDEARIENGVLILTSENQQHTGLNLSNLKSDRFAVEFEFHLKDGDPDKGHCIFETSGELNRALSSYFHASGQARLSHYVSPEEYPDIASSPFEEEIFNKVTFIVLGDQIAAFINGQIAYAMLDPDGSAVYTYQGLASSEKIVCEFDYYKLWDLSKVDFNP